MRKRILYRVGIGLLIAICLITVVPATAFAAVVLKQGVQSDEVYELQGRLKHLGYYSGDLTTTFGPRTQTAVRRFQAAFGLQIDGIAGDVTMAELRKATPKWLQIFTLKRGSTGARVKDLQSKLKLLDYYRGNLDGIYGSQMERAVSDFQYRYKLPTVDGVAGPATLDKIRAAYAKVQGNAPSTPVTEPPSPSQPESTTISKTSYNMSPNDLKLLSQAVYSEARGEPYIGQVAIAAVILNRTHSDQFPNTISGVIFQPGAFTAVADGQFWLTPNESAKKAVMDALGGWDPTGHALYYFNPDTATAKWIWSRPQIKKIGKHIFCK